MAELVAEALLTVFLEELFKRLASPKVVDFFKGRKLNSELLKLKTTMTSVKKLLGDAEEKQITNGGVREWLDNLKDAFYDADDLLDEIAYAALSSEMEAGPQTGIGRVWNFLSSQRPLVKIESKLVEIHEKLQRLIKQKNELGLNEATGNVLGLKEATGDNLSSQNVPITSLMRETTSLMDESVVYGRDEDKGVIIRLLLSDDANCNKLGLIPIVGMGGIGKTTLARSVYNDSKVVERFGVKAWIFVSEKFDVLKVTKNILNGVSTTKHDFNTLSTLELCQVELKNKLTDKKFLLVLDDVWNDRYDHWDLLLKPLKAGAKGSKIIVTTRLQSVASVIEVDHTHHLKEISEEECWALFSERAFEGMNSSEYPKFEEIGRKIVKKCNGLPLAAKSLGSLMRSKRKLEQWQRVLKNDIWKSSEDNILSALRLSYYFLPSHLKQCFAYCAIFPKGYLFKKEELVLLWMGEGFLGQAGFNMEREVTGEEYFDDLVSRSFFNPNGDVYRPGFIMHDLINDLARSVAGEFCSGLDDDGDSCAVPPRTRHLRYVQGNNVSSNILEGIASAPLLRTCLLADYARDYDQEEVIALTKFEHLRVLTLTSSPFFKELKHSSPFFKELKHSSPFFKELKLDDSIHNLKHLRYLNLSFTSIRILPESLCSLYHLEILLLVDCHELVELPLKLGKLTNLCVLDIEGTRLQKMPPHMGKLSNLQKLTYFMIGKESEIGIQELENLQQLRGRLVIRNLQNVKDVREALSANIKGKTHLKELELVWKGDADDPQGDDDDPEHDISLLEELKPHENVETLTISGYGGIEFPNWNDGYLLLGVVNLRLDGCRHCCQLPPLGQLVHLKQLSIRDFQNIVSIGPEFYGRCTSMKKPFQSLEVLRFEKMSLWQEWKTCGNEEEVFHLLLELYIIDCPALIESLPQYLPSLIKLESTESERLLASLPTIPRILDMDLKGLKLFHGRLEVTGSPLGRIELLGGCGFFNTLQEVRILSCNFLKCFPLEFFSNLKHLRIRDCPNFETTIIGNSISLISLEIDECPNFVSFFEVGLESPNLQRLKLRDCSNLKLLPQFLLYSLEELIIWYCPKLEPFLKGGLPLKLQRLEIDGCTELVNGGNQWNFDCLSSLLYFKIGSNEHAECFPKESLPTLTTLKIRSFPNLKSLEYKGIQHLTSLQCLSIISCPKLQLLPEEGLPSSLTCLKLSCLDNLESLVNSKIQQLSNLKKLSIESCPKLKSVPEEGLPSTITSLKISGLLDLESLNSKGLQNLTSLEKLKIENCPKLQSLPKEGLPSSLSSLTISSCPLLGERCEQEKGADWSKISHISNIRIWS